MIRNLKALGLALVAVLALSAIVASSASAIGKFTPGGVVVIGEDEGVQDEFTVSGSRLSCSDETFHGTINSPTNSEITINPTYLGCTTETSGNPVTVTTNGCHFVFTVTKTIVTDHDQGVVHIKCPGTNKIEIHHYSSAANHAAGASSCTVTVGPQDNLGTVTYTSNTAKNDVTVEGTIINVAAQTHGACSFGLTVNVTDAEYHLGATVKAVNGTRIHIG